MNAPATSTRSIAAVDPAPATLIRGRWSGANSRPSDWYAWQGETQVRARAEASYRRTQLKGLPSGDKRLGNHCVLVAGLGSVGAPAFVGLGRGGVGRLEGVDPDHYGAESFMTQSVSERSADRGELKARVQGAAAHAANPAAFVRCTAAAAQEIPLRLLHDADVWLAAGDNTAMLVWLGGQAAALGRVLVQGAVHPESGSAIIRAWDLRRPDSPCPACALGSREWAALDERHGCDPQAVARTGSMPTRTLSPLCRTAAQLMAFECLKRLCGHQHLALCGEQLTYSLWTHRAIRTELPNNPACRASHRAWNVCDAPSAWDQISPAMLMDQLGISPDRDRPVMRAELPWIPFALCGSCQRSHSVRRFGRVAQSHGRCVCGGTYVVPPAGLRSMIPATELSRIRDCSLASLRLPSDRGVGFFFGETWHYFLPPRSIFDLPSPSTSTKQESCR